MTETKKEDTETKRWIACGYNTPGIDCECTEIEEVQKEETIEDAKERVICSIPYIAYQIKVGQLNEEERKCKIKRWDVYVFTNPNVVYILTEELYLYMPEYEESVSYTSKAIAIDTMRGIYRAFADEYIPCTKG